MKPLLKWVGGKGRLVDELVKRLPRKRGKIDWGRYFEPFCGGAALFFHLEPTRAVLGDMNSDLISTYRTVKSDPEPVLVELGKLQRKHSEAHYYLIRDAWNLRERAPLSKMTPVRRAAYFMYLNRTCFNGLWRVNAEGHFNVPIGRYTDPAIKNPTLVRAASKALADTELHAHGYDWTTSWAEKGDFVYFDPPYDPISSTSSFTGYAKAGFGRAHQEELASWAHDLAKRGVRVMLSNNDTPLIRSLYPTTRWRRHRVRCGRSINSKADRRGDVVELLVTSY